MAQEHKQKSEPSERLCFPGAKNRNRNRRRYRKGVGGRGLATNKPPKRAQKVLQKYVPILLRGHRKKGTEKRPKSLAFEGFFAPTPSVRQPLFETSETVGTILGNRSGNCALLSVENLFNHNKLYANPCFFPNLLSWNFP